MTSSALCPECSAVLSITGPWVILSGILCVRRGVFAVLWRMRREKPRDDKKSVQQKEERMSVVGACTNALEMIQSLDHCAVQKALLLFSHRTGRRLVGS